MNEKFTPSVGRGLWVPQELRRTRSAADLLVVGSIATGAPRQPTGGWISGQLFDPSQYPGEPALTAEILGQVSSEVPIAILNANMHYLYVNSKAFEVAGITVGTP